MKAGLESQLKGHCGASQESIADDLPPHIDTPDQPLLGPRNRRYNRLPVDERSQVKTRSLPRPDNRGEPE
jgi:hypothetical protein